MKKITVFFIFLLCLFLGALLVFESQAAVTFEKVNLGDDTIRIQSKLEPVVDIQLLENTDACLINCHAILKFHPYVDIELPASANSEFRWDFIKEKPYMRGLTSHRFEILSNVSYDVSVPIYENTSYESTCYNPDNTSYNCTLWRMEKTGSRMETRYRDEFKPFAFWGNTMKAGGEYVIRLSGKKRATLGKNNIDWVPTIKGIEIDEWEWWNSSWERCRNINISNAGSSTLTDFPAYINLSYDSDMLSDYSDLRFVSTGCNEGGTLLPHEIENYTADYALIWVGIPSIPTTGTNISVYYKNDTNVDSVENATGVWDKNYVMVHHLEETDIDGGSGDIKDSTLYNNDGTTNDLTTSDQVPGKVDGSFDFDDQNTERVQVSDADSLDIGTGDVTVEAIFKTSSSNRGEILEKGHDSYNRGYHIYINDSGDSLFGKSDSATSYAKASLWANDNEWHYIVGMRDGDDLKIYFDGELNATKSGESSLDFQDSVDNLRIGNRNYNPTPFDGILDEVRVSNTSRSDDWINQTYQMIFNQGSYVTFGNEEFACPQDNTYINEDTVLAEGLFCNYAIDDPPFGILIINSSNIILDCNRLIMNSTVQGVNIIGISWNSTKFNNITLKNCNIKNFDHGIQIYHSKNASVINSNISENSNDISLFNTTDVKVINSTYKTLDFETPTELKRQWYVRVNVTNDTGPVEGVNVSIYNKDGNLTVTESTSDSGLTDEFILTQYKVENYSLIYYNYTPHNFSTYHPDYENNTVSKTINVSRSVHIPIDNFEIIFNVTSGETGLGVDNVTIYCNYSEFNQSYDTNNTYGPYTFKGGTWSCTFEEIYEPYYNKTIIFTVTNDTIIDVRMSKRYYLTTEEHFWLEDIYKCLYEGDCLALNLLLNINQTTTKTWNQFKRTDQTIVNKEEFVSKVVNATNNITINYTVNVPEKEGYGLIEGIQGYDDFLPIRIHYWFLDETNTSCYSQGNYSVALAEPHCQPLTVYTVGQINTQINFTVDLRPSLPAGNYTIVRDIEIDPDNVWIDYGHEIIGQIQVVEEEMKASAGVKSVREPVEDKSEGESEPQTPEDKATGMVVVEQVNVFYYVTAIISVIILIFVGLIYRNSRKRTSWNH